jgi:uncharacterized protein
LAVFNYEVFIPYLIGCVVPGTIVATLVYFLTVPLVRAYQDGRRKALRDKLDLLKKKPE